MHLDDAPGFLPDCRFLRLTHIIFDRSHVVLLGKPVIL